MSKKILGFSEGFHDAAATVIEEDQVLFAAHSERSVSYTHLTLPTIYSV